MSLLVMFYGCSSSNPISGSSPALVGHIIIPLTMHLQQSQIHIDKTTSVGVYTEKGEKIKRNREESQNSIHCGGGGVVGSAARGMH